jgi:DNA-binding transcriptional ArsR family regulator
MGSPWKALADDSRREILLLLKKHDMTPTEISENFKFTLPALSTHLRILKDANLVTEKKEGKNRFYSINEEKSAEILDYFEQMWGYRLKSLKEFVENKESKKKR